MTVTARLFASEYAALAAWDGDAYVGLAGVWNRPRPLPRLELHRPA